MIRIVLQWLISRKIDDGQEPGPFLSRFIRADKKTRLFYESLKALEIRLSRDASALLEQSASDRNVRPLKPVSRSLFQADRKRDARRRRTRIFSTTLTLFFLLAFGTVVFFLTVFGAQRNFAVAGSPSERSLVPAIQSDPTIQKELVRLCRYSPNEAGPFFTEP